MLNRAEFIGNLGRDPECRTTQSGIKVVSLSIGVTRKWKDRDGQQKEQTEWVRANVWGSSSGDGLAGVAERFLKKGSKVYIAGRMETRKWQDKDGKDQYSTEINVQEIELLDSRDGRSDERGAGNQQRSGGGGGTGWEPPPDLDEDIPFSCMNDHADSLISAKPRGVI